MRRHRLTKRERANRISQRIYNAGHRGISIKQIVWAERISISRIYYYLRLIRRAEKTRGFKIERLGKKFYRVREVDVKPRGRPIRARGPPIVELRGYLNYASDYRSRNIDIDCVMLVSSDKASILAGSVRIKVIVEARLGRKLASMLKFGVSEAMPQSSNHSLYRRDGGKWIEF